MSTTVVTSTPVVMAPPPKHPLRAHKKTLRGIGITGILIGLYAIGLGGYLLHMASALDGFTSADTEIGVSSFGWLNIGAGVWFIVAGSLAIAAGAAPNSCNVAGGIVVAILASLAAFGLMAREAAVVYNLYASCVILDYCGLLAGHIVAHAVMSILAFIEFVLVIVHASYSCGCCGRRPQSYPGQAAMTVTTHSVPVMSAVPAYGRGYAPLQNEYEPAYTSDFKTPAGGPPPTYY